MTAKITHRPLYKVGRKSLSGEEKETSKLNLREYQRKYKYEYNKYHPVQRMLWAARKRAKEKGIECTLVEEDIMVPTHCPYLNIPLVWTRPRGDSRRDIASLDRIDPSKGYTKDNIEVISWLANTMKNNATPELLVNFAKVILERYSIR